MQKMRASGLYGPLNTRSNSSFSSRTSVTPAGGRRTAGAAPVHSARAQPCPAGSLLVSTLAPRPAILQGRQVRGAGPYPCTRPRLGIHACAGPCMCCLSAASISACTRTHAYMRWLSRQRPTAACVACMHACTPSAPLACMPACACVCARPAVRQPIPRVERRVR